MDLVVFDLDGTLLNSTSEISPFTKETLQLLTDKNIAYTVATGRTMHSAQDIIHSHGFTLPHIYNNGVITWDPKSQQMTIENLLDSAEASYVTDVARLYGITPFVNTVDNHNSHSIFHSKAIHDVEKNLIEIYLSRSKAAIQPLGKLPVNSQITNISMIAVASIIDRIEQEISKHENLICYSGMALEGKDFKWIDIHHRLANKGGAVTVLKNQLALKNVICFGDSYNDLSMFELADECYAPENAKPSVKKLATSVIGHHHEDGIAHFLRERFSL